jgi:uncharacterized protein YfcZ (UPF0381/DUF406 family)
MVIHARWRIISCLLFNVFTFGNGGVGKTSRCAAQTKPMDALVSRIDSAFSFHRPDCVVLHSGDGCFDCSDVAKILDGTDCGSMMQSPTRLFATFPMDCMSADALLHYLPAIARESLTPDGLSVAEQFTKASAGSSKATNQFVCVR